MALSTFASASNRFSRLFSFSSSYSFGEALRLVAFCLSSFHSPVKLLPAVVGRWGYPWGSIDFRDGLALAQKLLSSAQLADDLPWAVTFDLHGASPCQVWLVGALS